MADKPTLFRSGLLVSEEGISRKDVLVADGKVLSVSENIDTSGYSDIEIIDVSGKYILPGLIDPHVHFELEAYNSFSSDDFYSGSRAAAAGGITTYIDFAIPEEGQKMKDAVEEKRSSASEKSIIDYSFHSQIIAFTDSTGPEMSELLEEGISSFKVFMPKTECWGLDDYDLYRIFKASSEKNALVMLHAENAAVISGLTKKSIRAGKKGMAAYPSTRPAFTEYEAVQRAFTISEEFSAPVYFCHVSTACAAQAIKYMKRKRSNVYMETCPQYLLLDDRVYDIENSYLFACCPPIRSKEDNYGLWRSFLEGYLDVIATDHCPFTIEQKSAPGDDFTKIPFGLPGVEDSFRLMYEEGVNRRAIALEKLYRMMSLNPARIFGLYPQKGTLLPGSDADMLILDTSAETSIERGSVVSKGGWSPYEGWNIKAGLEKTYSRGQLVYDNGVLSEEKGRGRFLKRTVLS